MQVRCSMTNDKPVGGDSMCLHCGHWKRFHIGRGKDATACTYGCRCSAMIEAPPHAGNPDGLAALLDSVLDPFIEQWNAAYKKARKDMPDGAEVYGSGYYGIVDGLTIAKVQLKKALEAAQPAIGIRDSLEPEELAFGEKLAEELATQPSDGGERDDR